MGLYTNKFYHHYFSVVVTAAKTIARNVQWAKFESEVFLLGNFIGEGDVCLDIGGAYARYAYPMSRIVGKNGHVYSFEPGSFSHHVFGIVKWFHGLRNVTLSKLALSDKKGTVSLHLPIKGSGKVGASLAHIGEAAEANSLCEKVPMTTVDDFCAEKGIDRVAFIKCDTEGAEYMVFTGAKKTIEASHPTVLSEVEGHLSRYGKTPRDVEEFFTGLGYGVFSMTGDKKHLRRCERIDGGGNYFFIHQSNVGRHVDSGFIVQ